MQHFALLLVNSRDEAFDGNRSEQHAQRGLILCPDCGTTCPPAGQVNKNSYALCSCGTYIQRCASDDDYSD